MSSDKEVAHATRFPIQKVESKLLGHHDVIVCDEIILLRFLRERCVSHVEGGKLSLDLAQLENHMRKVLACKEIAIVLPSFQWLGETSYGSGELKSLVPQRELSADVQKHLHAQIRSPVDAAKCLQKTQMAATFILRAGAAISATVATDMPLREYLIEVLKESLDSLPSAAEEICLSHVDSFMLFLKRIIRRDPMDVVSAMYKESMQPDLANELDQLISKSLDEVKFVAQVMGEFGEAYLSDGRQSGDLRVIDWLPYVLSTQYPDKLSAIQFVESLPSSLQLRHWGALYHALEL